MTLKDLEKRLEKEPDNLPLRVNVAGLMSAAGRKAEAVEHYRRVALAYRAQGRVQQALAVARSILELAPTDVPSQALVAELTEVKAAPPAQAAARLPSAAEPTKTALRAAPEPRPAVAMAVPTLDDLDTKPAGTTGSYPAGVLPQRVTVTGMRPLPVTTTKGPKSSPPVIRIPDKKLDSQPPATATFRSQPPPPPRRMADLDEVSDPATAAPRRSSFDIPTPLPHPVPYHLADPTSSQDRISRNEVAELDEALETRPGDEPTQRAGLAQAARTISSLIKPRSEKPTRNPFTPDPMLRPDAPPQPAPVRIAKPAVDPYADKPIVPRSDKPTRQPPLVAELRAGQPAGPRSPSTVPLRPAPAPILPARTPPRAPGALASRPLPVSVPVSSTAKAQPRVAQPAPAEVAIPVRRPPPGRAPSNGPATLGARPPPAARARPSVPPPAPRPPRETVSPETRVDNLPPPPEPGADLLPPPPAVPARAPSAIPRTPSYSDEIVAGLATRELPRVSPDELEKIATPPPTVPTEPVDLDDDHVTPVPAWRDGPTRAGRAASRDTSMDPQTDVHTSVARDTSLDMHAEPGTDVQGSPRDTRRDAAAEPPEDERTAPRELVGPEPIANTFFLAIPLHRRDAALDRCIRRVVRAGQTVIRQGETSHPLYLVVTGQLELRIERANGTLGKLDAISPGEFVGEGSLLSRSPAVAHVVASANSELLALPPHALFELAGAYPALWAALKDSAERRARAYEQLLRG
ncbi:MAG: cyclic nucleotide-binding domain-containing protein [Kofleriaceae bacterium]